MELFSTEIIKQLIGLFFTAFIFLVGFFYKYVMKTITDVNTKMDDVMSYLKEVKHDSDEADLALLRDALYRKMKEAEDMECVSRNDYEITKIEYQLYIKKGGNSIVEKLWPEYEKKALCKE